MNIFMMGSFSTFVWIPWIDKTEYLLILCSKLCVQRSLLEKNSWNSVNGLETNISSGFMFQTHGGGGGGGVLEVAEWNVLIRHTVIGAEQVKCLSLKGLIRELLVEADRLSRTVNTRNTFPTLVNNIWQVMSASDEGKLLSWRCKIIEQNNRRVSVLSEKFLSALIDHNCILSSYTFVSIITFISVRFNNIIFMTSLINSVLSYYFIQLHYDSLYTNDFSNVRDLRHQILKKDEVSRVQNGSVCIWMIFQDILPAAGVTGKWPVGVQDFIVLSGTWSREGARLLLLHNLQPQYPLQQNF